MFYTQNQVCNDDRKKMLRFFRRTRHLQILTPINLVINTFSFNHFNHWSPVRTYKVWTSKLKKKPFIKLESIKRLHFILQDHSTLICFTKTISLIVHLLKQILLKPINFSYSIVTYRTVERRHLRDATLKQIKIWKREYANVLFWYIWP